MIKKFVFAAGLSLCACSSYAAVNTTAAALGKEAAEHPGELVGKYQHENSFTVTGQVEELTSYMTDAGPMSQAVSMHGAPDVEHGAGSLLQLNPINDDASQVSKLKEGQNITAQCTSLDEVVPGYVMLRGCKFHS